MTKKHLLSRLSSVEFKEVAKQGAFVYCYLEAVDLSPYYVGISNGRWQRPMEERDFEIPSDYRRIVVLRSGLDWEGACDWEMTYIAHYGRVDIGTGILLNRTDGGDGRIGGPHMIRAAAKYGFPFDVWQGFTPLKRAKINARWERGYRGEALSTNNNILDLKAAKRFELSLEQVTSMSLEQRALARARYRDGVRGEALLKPTKTWEERREKGKETMVNRAAEKYGVSTTEFKSWDRATRCRIATRYLLGFRGDRLLGERYTARDLDVVSSKYGKTEEEWLELTKRQKKQLGENHRQEEIYAKKWNVNVTLVRKMPVGRRIVFARQVKAALDKDICPLIWHAIGDRGRSVLGKRVARGVAKGDKLFRNL